MTRIHPTAVVDGAAELADDVEIGPGAIVESDVTIGAGTVVRGGAVVRRFTSLGAGNFIDHHVVLGGDPQDFKFDTSTETFLRIGDNNVFREGVTISRATRGGGATVVGSGTMWMACSHAGHDATVEDNVVLANGAVVGGHATIGARTFLSATAMIHQFTWVGMGCMVQGGTGISTHAPPFCIVTEINNVVGLNVVGLRRHPDITPAGRREVKEAFAILYRQGLDREQVLAAMDAKTEWGWAAGEFRAFLHRVDDAEGPHDRGIGRFNRPPRGR